MADLLAAIDISAVKDAVLALGLVIVAIAVVFKGISVAKRAVGKV